MTRADLERYSKFILNEDYHNSFKKGDIVKLVYDDNSDCPQFADINNKNKAAFISFNRLSPYIEDKKVFQPGDIGHAEVNRRSRPKVEQGVLRTSI